MSFILNLGGIARMQIMNLLDTKAKGKSHEQGFIHGMTLYDKILISDEQQEEIGIDTPNGKMVTWGVLASIPAITVELEHNEASKLETLLKEAEISYRDEKMWHADLLKQLDDAKKPQLESKDVRDRRLADMKVAGRK